MRKIVASDEAHFDHLLVAIDGLKSLLATAFGGFDVVLAFS